MSSGEQTPDRVRWITREGQEVLLVDFSYCSGDKIESILNQAREVITNQPPASVLVLADLTGAELTREIVMHMKKTAALDRPFVRRSAWIGAEKLPKVWFHSIQTLSKGNFTHLRPGSRH